MQVSPGIEGCAVEARLLRVRGEDGHAGLAADCAAKDGCLPLFAQL